MFERFTDRARKIMALANQETQRLCHEYIGTEHILLGLLKEGSGVGANVLINMNVSLPRVREEVLKLVQEGAEPSTIGKLPQTPGAKQVIIFAIEEARDLNHSYVGSEHLLLGLLRENEGVAAQVLRNLGLSLVEVRKNVLDTIGAGKDESDLTIPLSPREALRVGIVGVSGYGGGEVLRLCATHPQFSIVYVAGESSAGAKLLEKFPGIGKAGELVIQKWDPAKLPKLDVLFASLPTGDSKEALSRVAATTKIVDIGGDHRFVEGWTYGLADVWPEKICSATRVANPGCYPAASIGALAPLVAGKLIDPQTIVIDAKSGVSGAGRGGGSTFGFAEVNEDVSAYGLFKHPHVTEIDAALSQIGNAKTSVLFTPHLIPMTRGLLATCYGRGKATTEQCLDAARKFYANRPFVRVVEKPPHTKWATGSNLLYVSYAADPERGVIIALGAIDNLGKGAAGQAIQNANLMTGQPETAGLESAPFWP